MSGSRALLIFAAAVGAASLGTACAQIIGADFDVTRGSSSASVGGSSGTSTGGTGGDAGPDGVAPDAGPGSGGAGGGPVCTVSPCPPELVDDNQDSPRGITLQGDHVYWTNAGPSASGDAGVLSDGAIRRAALAGGGSESVIGNLLAPNQIAADDKYIYWTSNAANPDGAVYRCAVDDCVVQEPVALAQSFPVGVAVHGAYVYWTTTGDGYVRRRLRDQQAVGGGGIDWEVGGFNQPNVIADGSDGVFVSEFSMAGKVWSLGNNKATQAITKELDTPVGVVMLGGKVCYTTYVDPGVVACIDPNTMIVTANVAANQSYPAGLATDGTSLYWVTRGIPGKIMRGKTDGSKPVEIATNQDSPSGIVIAGKWVYWTNYAPHGSVMRVLKD